MNSKDTFLTAVIYCSRTTIRYIYICVFSFGKLKDVSRVVRIKRNCQKRDRKQFSHSLWAFFFIIERTSESFLWRQNKYDIIIKSRCWYVKRSWVNFWWNSVWETEWVDTVQIKNKWNFSDVIFNNESLVCVRKFNLVKQNQIDFMSGKPTWKMQFHYDALTKKKNT